MRVHQQGRSQGGLRGSKPQTLPKSVESHPCTAIPMRRAGGEVRPRHSSHRARRQANTTIQVEHMHTLRVAASQFTAHYTAASLHHIVHVPGPAQRGPAASEDTGPLGHLCTGTGRLRLPCTRTTATHTTAPSALLTVLSLGVHLWDRGLGEHAGIIPCQRDPIPTGGTHHTAGSRDRVTQQPWPWPCTPVAAGRNTGAWCRRQARPGTLRTWCPLAQLMPRLLATTLHAVDGMGAQARSTGCTRAAGCRSSRIGSWGTGCRSQP
jgi:hypothetical protein